MKKFNSWKRVLLILVLIPFLVLFSLFVGVYWKQDTLVQTLIENVNATFSGKLLIKGSHISPFTNFPYVSIDLEQVEMYEDKSSKSALLFKVEDVYLGFNLLRILQGELKIEAIRADKGTVHFIQHKDGSFNITKAFANEQLSSDTASAFQIDIQKLSINQIHLTKINESTKLEVDAYIKQAKARFKQEPQHVSAALDVEVELNVMNAGDTTYFKHKDVELSTEVDFDLTTQVLKISPSTLKVEQALFTMDGTIDVDNDLMTDIRFHGNKPNFNLFTAFAPDELGSVFQRYDNAGKIFFEASIKGKAAAGNNPRIDVEFGCEDAFINNKESNKKLDKLFFKGKFTTGSRGNASTSEFSLYDVSARPEAGVFSGDLHVKNFDSPEIEMKLKSEFDLDFLAKFLSLKNLQDLSGFISLTMNFHDIVDLENPEKSIERLNESYFTELDVKNLSFTLPNFHLPVKGVNVRATMDGHSARIHQFDMSVGKSNISVSASISDLPAILHHLKKPVTADVSIKSLLIDIKELTSGDTINKKPIDEQIQNLSLNLKFSSLANAFTESPNLPEGEFFIENLYAKLTHYPHTLHDFHADVFIDRENFRIIDFTGMIDKSDFHFSGKLRNYDLWFLSQPIGDTQIDFNYTSNFLQLEDLFAYGGENFVPEDYRHETFSKLKIVGTSDLHFNKVFTSADVSVAQLEATMSIHPMRFENFKGNFSFKNQQIKSSVSGKLGRSEFKANLHYYIGSDSLVGKQFNYFSLQSPNLDFDQLFAYHPPSENSQQTPQDHESGFNIYDLPFSDMVFDFTIGRLNYHRYRIDDFLLKARTAKNHFIYIDTLSLKAAGGNLSMNGYFNGSNRDRIYVSPQLKIQNMDLDKLLFKFENFGQEFLVSENLHGQLNGTISGKVHVHADLMPILDDAELLMDLQVLNGRLDHFSALDAMSDFFKDKNLNRIRFDTLQNQLDIVNGVITIPTMNINSSLGFIEISGKQDVNLNMNYFVRVPFKLVSQVASQKLFGKSKEYDSLQNDAIQYRDESKRQRFINLKLTGTPDKFNITLGKDKGKN